MIHKLACALAHSVAMIQQGDSSDERIMAFGIEALFSSLLGLVLIFGAAILLGDFRICIAFLAGFIPIRVTAGGYHAPTQLICCIISTSVYIGCHLVAVNFEIQYIGYFLISGLSLLAILLLSPVMPHQKNIRSKKKQLLRKRSIAIGCFNIAAICGLYWKLDLSPYYAMYFLGVASATMLMVVATICQKTHKEREEEK